MAANHDFVQFIGIFPFILGAEDEIFNFKWLVESFLCVNIHFCATKHTFGLSFILIDCITEISVEIHINLSNIIWRRECPSLTQTSARRIIAKNHVRTPVAVHLLN